MGVSDNRWRSVIAKTNFQSPSLTYMDLPVTSQKYWKDVKGYAKVCTLYFANSEVYVIQNDTQNSWLVSTDL